MFMCLYILRPFPPHPMFFFFVESGITKHKTGSLIRNVFALSLIMQMTSCIFVPSTPLMSKCQRSISQLMLLSTVLASQRWGFWHPRSDWIPKWHTLAPYLQPSHDGC